MILECEKCESRFQLDENLLHPDGSKVRCSVCSHVFVAYPPESAPLEEAGSDEFMDDALAETVALDSPPVLEPEEAEVGDETGELDFDRAFEEAMEEEAVLTMAPDQIPEEEQESLDMAEAFDQAARIEDEVTRKDAESKISEVSDEMETEPTAKIPSSKKKPRRSMLLTVILIILVVVVGGGLGVFFFAPGLIPDSLSFLKPTPKQEIVDAGVRRLSFKDVAGSFVDSKTAGQLFVIRGMVTNNYPKGRSFILIRGSILDDKGKVVKRQMAYAGNAFSDQQLQDMTVDQINKELKIRPGKGNMNVGVKPGASIPVMVVFSELPDNLSEFTVEAVSSSHGE